MSSSNYGKFLKTKARKRKLTDGQGARKRKPSTSHRGGERQRHKRSFADLSIAGKVPA